MNTPGEILSAAVTRLSDKIDKLPSIREATVDSVSPLSVRFDTDTLGSITYGTLVSGLTVGTRVLTIKIRHYIWVLGAKGGAPKVGYSYQQTLKFDTVGTATFNKANYPGLRAVRVRVVGGGGSGGDGAGASDGQHSSGGGGGGGGYAESTIPADSLPANVTVTVGRGGRDISGFNGEDGNPSSFGSLVAASGGGGGAYYSSNALMIGAQGGAGGSGTAGDLRLDGDAGMMGMGHQTLGHGGKGGSSQLGGGGQGSYTGAGSGSDAGQPGGRYGGGGGGGQSNTSGPKGQGGLGASGVVLVELFM